MSLPGRAHSCLCCFLRKLVPVPACPAAGREAELLGEVSFSSPCPGVQSPGSTAQHVGQLRSVTRLLPGCPQHLQHSRNTSTNVGKARGWDGGICRKTSSGRPFIPEGVCAWSTSAGMFSSKLRGWNKARAARKVISTFCFTIIDLPHLQCWKQRA